MVHERAVSIRPDHPSLAGHFPGHPIVPGVVLLNEVLDTLRRGSTASLVVRGLPVVKFSAPLRPGEVVTIRVEEDATAFATFSCRVDDRLIASGSIEFTPDTAA
jgi:3-hydroxymyristoyl/3-hydroxydecanoyl-(acyl carrier protein) dehydratase